MKNAREKNCTGQEGFSGIYRAMYHVAASAYATKGSEQE
jgi:hypothetical protein